MRRGHQTTWVALTLHNVGRSAHRTRDQGLPALGRIHRTLTGQPHLVPEVLLLHRVIVVAVNALHFLHIGAHKLGQAGAKPVHPFLPIEERKPLRPLQILQISLELWGSLYQVRQILVGQGNPPLLTQTLGNLNVLFCNFVAHTAGTGVQEHPHAVLLVQTQFNEMVTTTQRT